jgi:cytochrome c553
MQGIAAGMTPEDMRATGAFYAGQKARGLKARDASLVKLGQSLWRGGDAAAGIPACSSCHAPNGVGIPKNYPRLAGQHPEYTYAQLVAFKQGQRGNDKEGRDVGGRVMRAVTRGLSDVQMKAVSEYAAGLR